MLAATSRPTLFVLCGLPLSGKTTLAQSLLTHDSLLIQRDQFLETIYRDTDTLSRLKSEAILIRNPVSRLEDSLAANAFNDALTKEYIVRITAEIKKSNASTVIVDGTHLQPLSRSFIQHFPDYQRIALVLTAPLEVCIERLQTTPLHGIRRSITPELLRRMSAVFEVPTLTEGFTEIRLSP